ncbi:MAG: phosphoribosylanthranilate isomerase [Thermodesulfobacteriota bacterium]|nr:phosphoribosylanthranilate isomerase [Thermodesulfobacteriota bacterium]
MTWIKICGITNIEDGLEAVSLGVNALGFIFAPSPRRVEPSVAKEIISVLPETLLKVGVFVNEDPEEVLRVAEYCGLNVLQFHGQESQEYCQKFFIPVFKAIRIKNLESLKDIENYHDVTILLDTYSPVQAGGTGNPFPGEIALKAKEERDFILSGGLSPSNVGEAIKKVRPMGVDVCSGVEVTPGKKDPLKMRDFIKEVRKADEQDRSNI